MTKKLRVYDHIPLEIAQATRIRVTDANLRDQDGTPFKGVYVTVKATHAARRTGNHGLYLPSEMKAGMASFTSPYEKPVGVHHDRRADPVGRIKLAEYVTTPLPSMFIKQFGDFNRLNDSIKFSEQVDIITQLADTGILYDDNFEGLGYALVSSLISDPDAAQKIRDRRYQTVSITAITDKALCSICHSNLLESPCEHELGEVVDGHRAFMITGKLEYEGLDWVNLPADSLATLVAVSDTADTPEPMYLANSYNHSYGPHTIVMTDALISVNEYNNIISEEAPKMDKNAQDSSAENTENSEEQNTETLEDKTQIIFDKLFSDGDEQVAISDEDRSTIYEAMSQFINKDEQLSIDKRKILPKSACCGPDHSFPVLDLVHVKATKALLELHKVDAREDKASIETMATLLQKAKALGMDMANNTEDDVPEEEQDSSMDITKLEDDVLQKLFIDTESLLINRKLKVDTYSAALANLEDKKSAVEDMLVENKAIVADLQTQLGYLRDELKHAYTESTIDNQRVIDATTSIRTLAIDSMDVISQFIDNKKLDRDIFTQLSQDALLDKLTDMQKEFDMDSLLDKIHSGTTVITDEERIKDPTEPSPMAEQDASPHANSDILPREKPILEKAQALVDKKGADYARKYLQRLSHTGIIVDEQRFIELLNLDSSSNTEED